MNDNQQAASDAPAEQKAAPPALLPHQARLLGEQAELADRLDKLSAFVSNPLLFDELDLAERQRLMRQQMHMVDLNLVLLERIAAFQSRPPAQTLGGPV